MKTRKQITTAIITAVATLVTTACSPNRTPSIAETTYLDASNKLYASAMNENPPKYYQNQDGDAVVILSYSDGEHRAYVQTGTGKDVRTAWGDANGRIVATIRNSKFTPKYIKADVVTSVDTIPADTALDILTTTTPPYPFGIATDGSFNVALLPQELDSIRPFKDTSFDLEYLNAYLTAARRQGIESFPNDVLTFQTRSWFIDTRTNEVTELNARGVREITLSEDELANIITTAGEYLMNHLADDGRFQYLLYPQALAEVPDYNIVRHAGALYAMTQYAATSGDPDAKTKIDAGIEYLKTQSKYTSDGAAYVHDTDEDSYMLGTSGIALLALENYAVVFNSDEHADFLRALADGILTIQREDGHAPHVLDDDLDILEDYRTVYFDGEACFGLCRAYVATGDERYRDAAVRYADYMVENDYWTYQDHWVAYSMNEMTKLFPAETKYYDLALRTFSENVTALSSPTPRGPTRLELLTAVLETYERAVENSIPTPDGFDVATLNLAIADQTRKQLDCYLFPERAMYSAACDEITGAFYDNKDETWEIRIDTIQHHLSGYYHHMLLMNE